MKRKTFDSLVNYAIAAIISFALGAYFQSCLYKMNSTPPVEGIVNRSDSLIKVNDSIKIVVNNLDSIKDAKIIEVQALDNDSTLKLFYELISK